MPSNVALKELVSGFMHRFKMNTRPMLELMGRITPVTVIESYLGKMRVAAFLGVSSTASTGWKVGCGTVPEGEKWTILWIKVDRAGVAAEFSAVKMQPKEDVSGIDVEATAGSSLKFHANVAFASGIVMSEGDTFDVYVSTLEAAQTINLYVGHHKEYI